jgi:hypothetical protein
MIDPCAPATGMKSTTAWSPSPAGTAWVALEQLSWLTCQQQTAAWAGFLFLSLWLNAHLKIFANARPAYWKLILFFAPLLGATLICGSLTIVSRFSMMPGCPDRCRTNSIITLTRLPEASLASFALSPRIECTTIPARSSLRSLSLLMGPPVYDWRVNHIPLPIVGSNVAGTHPLYGSHALRTNEPFGVNEIASGSNEKALPANGARHGV